MIEGWDVSVGKGNVGGGVRNIVTKVMELYVLRFKKYKIMIKETMKIKEITGIFVISLKINIVKLFVIRNVSVVKIVRNNVEDVRNNIKPMKMENVFCLPKVRSSFQLLLLPTFSKL